MWEAPAAARHRLPLRRLRDHRRRPGRRRRGARRLEGLAAAPGDPRPDPAPGPTSPSRPSASASTTAPGAGPYGGRVYDVWFGEAADPAGAPLIIGTAARRPGARHRLRRHRQRPRRRRPHHRRRRRRPARRRRRRRPARRRPRQRPPVGRRRRRLPARRRSATTFWSARSASDRLTGNGGNDILIGGTGRDVLIGGAGGDLFRFRTPGEAGVGAGRDVIADFQPRIDHIDLRQIDARPDLAGDQAFVFGGSTPTPAIAALSAAAWSAPTSMATAFRTSARLPGGAGPQRGRLPALSPAPPAEAPSFRKMQHVVWAGAHPMLLSPRVRGIGDAAGAVVSVWLRLSPRWSLPRRAPATEPIFAALRRRGRSTARRSACCRPRSPRPATIAGRSTAPGAPAARPRSRPTPAREFGGAAAQRPRRRAGPGLSRRGRPQRLGLQLPARARHLAGAAARPAEARRGRGGRRAALERATAADRPHPPLRPPPRPGAGTPPSAEADAGPEALDHAAPRPT